MDVWETAVRLLARRGMTVTVMESCTGGGIADAITNVAGASEVFYEGYVAYSNRAKVRWGVPDSVIEAHTVYSTETAAAMAQAARQSADADVAIGVTGQLGRVDPANPVSEVNRVWCALVDRQGVAATWCLTVEAGTRAAQKAAVIDRVGRELCTLLQAETR